MKFKEFGRADNISGKMLKEELLKIQENKCLICKKNFSSSFNTHTDHDHINGDIRGILCNKCNLLLGICNDNIDILKSAIEYLINNPLKTILDELEPKIRLEVDKIKKGCNDKAIDGAKTYWANSKSREEQSIRKKEYFSDPINIEKRRKETIGENNPMFGKKHTEESRNKISKIMREYWSDPKNREKKSKQMKEFKKDKLKH